MRAYAVDAKDIRDPVQWRELLGRIDRQINLENGQSTAVIAAMFDQGASGASVGDSAAWLVDDDGYEDLTAGQVRKPLLGTGEARPVEFKSDNSDGTLLLASDGLVKYAPPARIAELIRAIDLQEAPRKLIDLVRLKSGALQDDVAVVLCRKGLAPQHGVARRRYILTDNGELLEDDV